MFVFTTRAQPAILNAIDVECQTEWIASVTSGCERKITCKVSGVQVLKKGLTRVLLNWLKS